MTRFIEAARVSVGGLDALDLVSGQNLLQNVRGQFELLLVARQGSAMEPFEPISTREDYSLEELLELRAQWRALNVRRQTPELRLGELESQAALLRQRIDSLLRQYAASEENSPARILLGLQRVSARLEYEQSLQQSSLLQARLDGIDRHREALESQIQYALGNLVVRGEVDWNALDSAVDEARTRVTRVDERLADLQQALLQVLSDSDARPALEILRKQQLTRDSVELSLAHLQELEARAIRAWFQLRTRQLPADFNIQQAVEEASSAIDEARRQLAVWTTASRNTILTPSPSPDLNSTANIRLAHEAARETLDLTEKAHGVIDELNVLSQVLTADQVGIETGLDSLWARIRITLEETRYVLLTYLDITLFHIGDTPVTIGSIIKMLLVLAFGFALSWFIRHLLKRLEGRRQFAQSPVAYTLGRLTHYLIILIAVFAAFGSIGLDFSNFALIAGALSVGIGFGLQSIVNNFVSGLILLFEGSLRVGDYIEMEGDVRGVVKEINTRATVINTNDSLDVVVPNSQFVTNKLTNWTLREPMARFRIEFGVAYGSDKEIVRTAALEAASKVDYVIHHNPGREPEVWLVNFGDSALVFQLLAWVSKAGVRRPHRVRAAFMWELETQLREAGIEIPFPQRDLHLRSGFTPSDQPTPVKLEPPEPKGGEPGTGD
jgi:small-conductance mechanosensitive channel